MPVEGARLLHAYLLNGPITQKQAATALHVSGPTINDWLQGKKRPRAEHRKAIAKWTRSAVPVASWLSDVERTVIANAKREAA